MADDDKNNAHLLNSINKALNKWKVAEERLSYEGVYARTNNSSTRVEMLKQAYIDLLKEARERNLSLTTDQMIQRILDSNMDIE